MDPPDTAPVDPYKPPPLDDEEPPVVATIYQAYLRPPRLGIIHLMAWIAVTALLVRYSLFWTDLFGDFSGEMSAIVRAIHRVLGVCYNALHGALLVAAGILLVAKFRRLPGRLQPGHWLVLVSAPAYVVHTVTIFTFVFIEEYYSFSDFFPMSTYGAINLFLGWLDGMLLVAYVVLMVTTRDGRRWRVAFGSAAAMSGIVGACKLISAISYWGIDAAYYPIWICSLAIVLLVVAILDVRRGPRRDWLHWFGLVSVGASALLSIAWRIWVWMMQMQF